MRGSRPRSWHEDEGAAAVIVAISMVVVLGIASLAIDVGAMETKRSQLQDAADAAALTIAQACATANGTLTGACPSAVQSVASTTAAQIAAVNVNDGSVNGATSSFTSTTVRVTVTDTQPGFFTWALGRGDSTVRAAATASWIPTALPIPLSFPECDFGAPGTTQMYRYDKVSGAVSLLPYILSPKCGPLGTDPLLAPGWAQPIDGSCATTVNLLGYVASTVNSTINNVLSTVIPDRCVYLYGSDPSRPGMRYLMGRQVLMPVYSNTLSRIVVNGVLLNAYTVQRYALVTVTGWDFSTISVPPLQPAGSVTVPAGTPPCTDLSGLPLLGSLVGTCQGLSGTFQGFVTPAQARDMSVGARLVD